MCLKWRCTNCGSYLTDSVISGSHMRPKCRPQPPRLCFGWLFWMFAVFIVACGTTHFMEVWVLWC